MGTKARATGVDKHVGARVKMRRLMLVMSQETLGKCIGVTFQQMQKYESGANRIAAGRLWQIAQALDVSTSFFFEDIPASVAVTRASGRGADLTGTPTVMTRFFSCPHASELAECFAAMLPADQRLVVKMAESLRK